MLGKKYETALQKAKRYQSELDAGCYLKNGRMVEIDDERRAFCEGYIGEIRSSELAKEKGVDSRIAKRQVGSQIAANDLRKEYNYRKYQENKKIADNYNKKHSKQTENK